MFLIPALILREGIPVDFETTHTSEKAALLQNTKTSWSVGLHPLSPQGESSSAAV